MSLLSREILIVTGKGGTGKTTVASAIGLWAARAGKRTLLVECNGARQIPALFMRSSEGYTPTRLHPGLSAMSITAEEAIEDYVVKQIKVRKLYKMVFRNRVMGPFMDAVPGLHDAVHLGKVYDLIEDDKTRGRPTWDLVIVDAPATGHGLHMLASARSMMELTRAGPVYEGVKLVHDVISDTDRTGLVLTCLPEDLPVNETIELNEQLREADHRVAGVVLNEMNDVPLPSTDQWAVHGPALHHSEHPGVREAAEITERWIARQGRQLEAMTRLASRVEAPLTTLPFLMNRSLGFTELELLSHQLEANLEVR